MAINLGDKVRDKISGFTGIAAGRSEFLYGCKRILVTPDKLDGGKTIDAQWFDEQQVVVVKKGVIEAAPSVPKEPAKTGGPQHDARRSADARR